jgi:glycosyltransferase involved in cell wall biosynthesis
VFVPKLDKLCDKHASSSRDAIENKSLNIAQIYPKEPIIVYYDMTRLISRRKKPFATGIDRVDLEYIKQHLRHKWIELRCITLVDNRIKILGLSVVQKYINDLDQIWSGVSLNFCPSSCLKENNYIDSSWLKRFRLKKLGQLSFNSLDFIKDPKRKSFYFNASHVGILSLKRKAVKQFFDRFKGSVVAYIHDIIPLSHKGFTTQAANKKLKRYLRNALKYQHTLLFNSKFTKRSFFDFFELDSNRYRTIIQYPILERKLIGHVRGSIKDLAKEIYFVSVGTIEPRKNHLFLLKIWEQMIYSSEESIPKLVLVGKRGWKNSETFNLLDSMKKNSGCVIEINDANDSEIAFLNKHSQAALFPSLAEGFHLSMYEALHHSKKVLVSNIETHREILKLTDYSFSNNLHLDLNFSDWLCAMKINYN